MNKTDTITSLFYVYSMVNNIVINVTLYVRLRLLTFKTSRNITIDAKTNFYNIKYFVSY